MQVVEMSSSKGSADMPAPSEYMPLVQQQADVNRLNQSTPFGGTQYVYPTAQDSQGGTIPATGDAVYSTPQAQGDWLFSQGIDYSGQEGGAQMESDAYNDYLSGFTPELLSGTAGVDPYSQSAQPTVQQYLSPEMQTIWDKQFQPDAYQSYADEYMAESQRLLDPIYSQQTERMQQEMANRGQPVGGELYTDTYADLMDAQNRGWDQAAFGAQQASTQAQQADWNRLMSAMGGTQVQFPGTDVMSPANMAMNTNMADAQAQQQQSSNMWNTAAALGSAWLMSDRRLKENIEPIGKDEETGLTKYRFNYKSIPDKTFIGAMADEVEKFMPDAVMVNDAGYKMVDYGKIGFPMVEV